MRKGIIIWLLIIAVTVAVLVFTAPDHGYGTLRCHSDVSCAVADKTCARCGKEREVFHELEQIDCYTGKCKYCSEVVQYEEERHIEWCSGLDNCLSCGADMTEYQMASQNNHRVTSVDTSACVSIHKCSLCGQRTGGEYVHHSPGKLTLLNAETCEISIACSQCSEVYTTKTHNMETIAHTCKTIRKCTFCSYTVENSYANHEWTGKNCFSAGYCKKCGIQGTGIKHTWVPVDCGEETYCSECGIDGGRTRYPRHNFEPSFLRVFNQCTICGRMQYETANLDLVARLAEVFGVLLVAFGFQYAIRKRKYMRIKWLIVIFLWLEENTFFGNLCPAVLWKKKLD